MVRPGGILDEEALVRIARSADVPFFRVDADRNVVEMSPALERLTGFAADDILGRSCLRVHRCTECLRGCGVFDHGLVTDKELELYRADGSTVRVRKSGGVFVDDDGAISGALEIIEPVDPVAVARDPVERTDPAHTGDPAQILESVRIRDALERSRYNRTRAARLLGISRTTLWRKMREHRL